MLLISVARRRWQRLRHNWPIPLGLVTTSFMAASLLCACGNLTVRANGAVATSDNRRDHACSLISKVDLRLALGSRLQGPLTGPPLFPPKSLGDYSVCYYLSSDSSNFLVLEYLPNRGRSRFEDRTFVLDAMRTSAVQGSGIGDASFHWPMPTGTALVAALRGKAAVLVEETVYGSKRREAIVRELVTQAVQDALTLLGQSTKS